MRSRQNRLADLKGLTFASIQNKIFCRGWLRGILGVVIQLCHVGARFEALDALISMPPSDFIAILFTYVPRLPPGMIVNEYQNELNPSMRFDSQGSIFKCIKVGIGKHPAM